MNVNSPDRNEATLQTLEQISRKYLEGSQERRAIFTAADMKNS
ncbi:hypothetical protein [Blastopirellula retiformator]|uniref:Uncharacterized protein n=1 Tax=Blastopirellula retiformator TaxID=2527970 RepID=A0A5C5VKF7_9BACT|nr:hypothetical protein [Blastopirellula retiformator]TWT38473.1 hypothetical protein Enr8_01650 [Blastopirellula retiformator]